MSRRRPPSEEESELASRAPDDYRLAGAIGDFLHGQGLGTLTGFHRVLESWSAIVGDDVAAHCTPRRIDRDELVVEVDRAAWSTELAFHRDAILANLARLSGVPPLRSLKVHVRARRGVEW